MALPVVLEPSPDTTVQKILLSPKLPFYVKQFQSLLDSEREKREHFYEEITDSFFAKDRARHFTPGQVKFPAPDFIVEVLSPSTEKNDRGVKLEDYALHGVTEYWIIDPDKQTVEQYLLSEEKKVYELGVKVINGPITSAVVNGFSIPVQAIFDEQAQWKALQEIVGKS